MVSSILGGIGLFLLGMVLMTEGLRSAAGDALRRLLIRLTGGPIESLLSGAAMTALVQSSSATTLTTIGFVSAGLLTFPQAVGVIFGANLGTTSTAWLVSAVGLKFKVSLIALPLVGAGTLMKVLSGGRHAFIGQAIAGFGLIFVGIDFLQDGMQTLSSRIDPAIFPKATIAGSLLLVGAGIVMTVLMQSSSAAIATTLAALASGTITLAQGAALVIGQNVGTTVTAFLAAIGASVAAKRTALAHILFNAITGVVAFLLIPVLLRLIRWIGDGGDAVTLAAFHTTFNLLGVALLLPFIGRFADLVTRLIPERGNPLTRNLDASVRGISPVAVEAARRTARSIASVVFEVLVEMLNGARPRDGKERLTEAEDALAETRRFMAGIRSSPEMSNEYARHVSTLHALDHLAHLADRIEESLSHSSPLSRSRQIMESAGDLVTALGEGEAWLRGDEGEPPVVRLEAASAAIARARIEVRKDLLERTALGELDPEEVVGLLDASHRIERIAYHAWRVMHHVAGGGEMT